MNVSPDDAYVDIDSLLRPPYGETNKTLNKYLRKRWGLSIIQWDLDAGDASGVSPEDTIAMYMTFKKGDRYAFLLQIRAHRDRVLTLAAFPHLCFSATSCSTTR